LTVVYRAFGRGRVFRAALSSGDLTAMPSTRYSFVLALIVFLATAGLGDAQTKAERDDGTVQVGPLGEQVAAYAEALRKEGFHGAVLAARDGKVVAALGVGFADI